MRARGREADRARAHGLLHDPAHGGEFVFGRLLGERAFAHDVGAKRRVADVASIVDAFRHGLHRIEVVGVGLPGPLDAFLHRLAGDVLGPLEVSDREILLFFGTGREGEPAVAHHHAGDAVVAGRRADAIPEHLRVHVGVAIDEARGHDVSLGVDGLGAVFADAADQRNLAVRDSDVGMERWRARTVDNETVLDDQIVWHSSLSYCFAYVD